MTGLRTRLRRDDGATAIEFVLLTPVLFFMIFATVQFGMYFFARHVAIASAQAGARVARAEAHANPQGWQEAAKEKSQSYVAQLGPKLLLLDGPNEGVTTQRRGNVVRVEIVGHFPRVLPLLDFPIHVASEGPIERFVEDE